MARAKRITVDLPSDGRVYVIDPNHQFFNGKVYYRTKGYYACTVNGERRRLHVDVYEFHRGKISDGCIVHHEHRKPDGSFDKDENNIEWLRLMTKSEHNAYHIKNRMPVEKNCEWCGKVFITAVHSMKYCSKACKIAYTNYISDQRAMKQDSRFVKATKHLHIADHSGNDDKGDVDVRICPICRHSFTVNCASLSITCNNPECIATLQRVNNSQRKLAEKLLERRSGMRIFVNDELKIAIRCIIIKSKTWFVGKDVAKALGYSNTRDALSKHVNSTDRRLVDLTTFNKRLSHGDLTFKSASPTAIINLKGLLRLVNSSKMPKTDAFIDWITGVVLPKLIEMSMGMSTVPQSPAPPSLPEPKSEPALIPLNFD